MFIPSIKSIFIIILSLVILFLSYFYTQNYFSDISTKTLIIFLSSFFLAILIIDFIFSPLAVEEKINYNDTDDCVEPVKYNGAYFCEKCVPSL